MIGTAIVIPEGIIKSFREVNEKIERIEREIELRKFALEMSECDHF